MVVPTADLAARASSDSTKPTPAPHRQMVNPPEFTDPTPDDITISCLADLPPKITLTATDDTDPSFPKEITPTDSPDSSAINICTGGVIVRTWTATDMDGMMTSVSQTITIEGDNEGPPIIPALNEFNDTVACELSKLSGPESAVRYDVWLSTLRLAIGSNFVGTTDCSGPDDFTDNAPATFDEDCATLNVLVTLIDDCGNSTQQTITYTTIDTVAPVLIGIPTEETLTLSCDDPIPPFPTVTAMDNCDSSPELNFSET
ncbi:MAG: hypothetical protein F6K19_21205, partial [Cyanothece sp. SIO1E1]|nr:hypothetical protein [Cyanothece sp. SIO1E1]